MPKPTKTLLIIAFLGLGITACASPEQIAARQAAIDANDHAECVQMGFKPNTPQYGDCRLRIKEMRSNERAAYNNRVGYGFDYGYGRRGSHYGFGHRW